MENENVNPVQEQLTDPMQEKMVPEESFSPEEFNQGPATVGNQEIEKQAQPQGEPMVEDDTYDMESTDENAPDFEPLPVSWYLTTITGIKNRSSKAGDPMVVVEFTVDDPEKPQYQGRKVSLFALMVYDKKPCDWGRKSLKKALVRAGVDIDWANFRPRELESSGIALGKKVKLHLTMGDPYTDDEGVTKKGNNIKDFRAVGAGDEFLSAQ